MSSALDITRNGVTIWNESSLSDPAENEAGYSTFILHEPDELVKIVAEPRTSQIPKDEFKLSLVVLLRDSIKPRVRKRLA